MALTHFLPILKNNTWTKNDYFYLLALSVAYFFTGIISLQFANQGNNAATLIWLPSGLALGLLLSFGKKMLPGVFLGAFLTEVVVFKSMHVAILIALGNTLEAYVAFLLISQFTNFRQQVTRTRDVYVLFLAAVVAGSVGAGASFITLNFLFPSSPISWADSLSWWMGDSLSLLVIAPLVYSFFDDKHSDVGIAPKLAEALFVLVLLLLLAFLPQLIQIRWPFISIQAAGFLLLVIWTSVRFSQRFNTMVILMVACAAVFSAVNEQAFFNQLATQFDHFYYGCYVALITIIAKSMSGLNYERAVTQTTLDDQVDLYNALLQARSDVDEGVVIIQDGKVEYVNPAMLRMGGYSKQDVEEGLYFIDMIHPSDRVRCWENYQKRMQGLEVPNRYEAHALTKDGRPVPVEFSIVRYGRYGNRIVVVVVDISEQKQAQLDLLRSQDEYQKLVNTVKAVMWRASPDGAFTFVSQEAESLLGFSLNIWTTNRSFWYEKTHEDDRDWVKEYCAEILSNPQDFTLDYRMVAADRRVVWVQNNIRVILNELGEVQEFIGLMLDITPRKEAEASLRLSRSVFENTAEGILITDANFNVLEVNQAYIDITGYMPAEVIGKQPNLIDSSSANAEGKLYRKIWDILEAKGYWAGEVWNRRKNHERYPQWLSISTVKNADETVQNYVAVFSDMSERKQSEHRLEFLANHDALTHLPNRILLQSRIEQALVRAHRNQSRLAVLFIDLDRFKVINDTLGHQTGDLLLQECAKRLKENLRESDTVARQGGDEFVVLIEDVLDNAYLSTVASKIMDALNQPFILMGHELFVTASIGISVYPDDGLDLMTLLKNADVAMYRAKDIGRNAYQFYAADSNVHSLERLGLESALRRALERDEFKLYYQAKIDLRTKQVVGAEALLRWQHPELGLLSPKDFIALAEETGIIVPIGAWVLSEACKQAKQWQSALGRSIRVGVNLSARQFRDDALQQTILHALADSGLAADCLELEITESVIMQNADRANEMLQYFRELGTHVLIDDFGTGYSSLSYLKQLPIDALKIDRSFVRDIPKDNDDMAITEAIIAMAHSLNIKVVAEGVETQEQFDFLQDLRCDQIQGFMFSKPVLADRVSPLLYGKIVKGSLLQEELDLIHGRW